MEPGQHMDTMWGGMGGAMGIGMFLVWGLALAALVAAALLLVRWAGGGRAGEGRQSPIEALKLRYARGEIDRDTFERMKRDLEGQP